MAEKMFILKENQKIWDSFFDDGMDEWNLENKERLEQIVWTDEEKEIYSQKIHGDISAKKITPYWYESKKKRMCLQQYKPIVLEFEWFIKKSFNTITVEDIENFSIITNKKSKLGHLNTFLLNCVKSGIINNNNVDFLISLLPDIYREIGEIIAENGKERSYERN